MTPIGHGGPSIPLMPPPDKQPESKAVEQPAAEPAQADKKDLPDHEIRPGQENLQRFLAIHGKASGGKEIQPDATADADDDDAGKLPQGGQSRAADPDAAESSSLHKRATGAQKGNSSGQTGEASEAPDGQRGNANNGRAREHGGWSVLQIMIGIFALSAGFRFIRNPGDFASHPGAALSGALRFSERVDEQTLSKANHAVLEQFGKYIPKDSRCHQVQAELSFDMPTPTAAAFYSERRNYLGVLPYQFPGTGLAQTAHEYCHCYSHPKYRKALEQTPNEVEIDESLTEHIKDKIPKDGPLAKLMSRYDSGYHDMDLSNGKNMIRAAQELEAAVGEATLMRAYFGGDKDAIRKVSRAAVDIFPKSVTLGAWNAIGKLGNTGKTERQQLAECFVGASLLATGKVPPYINGLSYASEHLSVYRFSQINSQQQKEILNQAKQARERLGEKFDQAFFNFDEKAAKAAMKAVHQDLQTNWKCALPEQKSYF